MIDDHVRRTAHSSDDSSKYQDFFFSFLNDITEHNEKVSSIAPFLKQDVTLNGGDSSLPLTPGPGNNNLKHNLVSPDSNSDYSLDSAVFELEMNDTPTTHTPPRPMPSPSPRGSSLLDSSVSGWQVVSARKPSFPASVRPTSLFSSTPPHDNSPQTGTSIPKLKPSSNIGSIPGTAGFIQMSPQTSEAMFPKIGQWTNTPQRPANTTAQETPWGMTPESAESGTPKQSGLSKAMKNMGIQKDSLPVPGSPSNGGETLSAVIDLKSKSMKTGKLSQRERRKLQKESEKSDDHEPAKFTSTATTNGNPWKTAPPAAKNQGQQLAISSHLDSPFAAYEAKPEPSNSGTSRQSLSAVSSTSSLLAGPKMAQIIQQEQRAVDIKAQERSKSLREIQQEEEFARWWAEESAKVQKEQQLIQDLANPSGSGKKNKNNSNGTSRRKPKGPVDVNNTNSNSINHKTNGPSKRGNGEDEANTRGENGRRGGRPGGGGYGRGGRGGGPKGKGKVRSEELKI